MFEKKSLVVPVPIDVTEGFLISEIQPDETVFVDGFVESLMLSSSKLCSCWLSEEDSLNNPT